MTEPWVTSDRLLLLGSRLRQRGLRFYRVYKFLAPGVGTIYLRKGDGFIFNSGRPS